MHQFEREQLARADVTLIILVYETECEAGEEICEEEVYSEIGVGVAD